MSSQDKPSRPVATEAGEDARVRALEDAVSDLQRSRPLCCYDCGRRYEKGPDLVVSNEDWNRIAPHESGGGVLCPNCMHDRFVASGVPAGSVRAQFKSGPFADDLGRPVATGSKARAMAVVEAVVWPNRDQVMGAGAAVAALDRAKFFADEATLAEIAEAAQQILDAARDKRYPETAGWLMAQRLASSVSKLRIGGGK